MHLECAVVHQLGLKFCFLTGPEILLFKRFKEKQFNLVHRQPKQTMTPLISACDKLKAFIAEQLQLGTLEMTIKNFFNLRHY